MMTTSKGLCAVLVLVMAMSGPLTPLAVMAQGMQPATTQGPGANEPSQGAKTGAGFLNVIYVPGKAILCGTGTVASTALMLLTFGSAYHAAVSLFNEGCGGHWVLTPSDVSGKRLPEDDSY
jgi:hypothetical protein